MPREIPQACGQCECCAAWRTAAETKREAVQVLRELVKMYGPSSEYDGEARALWARAEAALRAGAAALRAQGWQPMETVPATGAVDLWVTWPYGEPARIMECWRDSTGVWLRWEHAHDGRYPTPIGGTPTHWMPLPSPPEAD